MGGGPKRNFLGKSQASFVFVSFPCYKNSNCSKMIAWLRSLTLEIFSFVIWFAVLTRSRNRVVRLASVIKYNLIYSYKFEYFLIESYRTKIFKHQLISSPHKNLWKVKNIQLEVIKKMAKNRSLIKILYREPVTNIVKIS